MLPDSMYDYRPEQPQSIEVDRCLQCGNGIFTGEEYYNFNGEVVCEECLDEYIRHFKKEGE
ncbi:hypothetical protein SAMN05444401_1761 [Clostridium amylolyticum]|uniref:Uncharacterized protein n=1 Tax=Clostridium amylolyticum TaxID=1121298 RepID=A0A1M6F0D1_9CLOT|nr:hypothetical protein [Clostridium amylolyticum]SHI91143.1 hypothetical protein SAMN05444401_1761 [Clostridium amylolyticum]